MTAQPTNYTKLVVELCSTNDPASPHAITLLAMSEEGDGIGHGLMGPRGDFWPKNPKTVELTQEDADSIRLILDRVFPTGAPNPQPPR